MVRALHIRGGMEVYFSLENLFLWARSETEALAYMHKFLKFEVPKVDVHACGVANLRKT
jgi:hypothetical protein